MPAHKGAESFVDAITFLENRSIHMYVGHAIKARQQWLMFADMQLQAGWSTAIDRKIRQWLVTLDRLRVGMIHSSGNQNQKIENLEALAKGLKLQLPDQSQNQNIGDGIARASGRPLELAYKLDGSDPDIPMRSKWQIRNVHGLTLLTALDLHIVETTRLDARHATHRITPEEGMTMFAGLLEMWMVCDQFGGDEKRIGVTEGVLPSEEPEGPNRSGAVLGDPGTASLAGPAKQ